MFPNAFSALDLNAHLPGHDPDAPVHSGQNVLRRQHFKFKYSGAGQNRVKNGEIRIFRGGGHQSNFSVLNELQQRLLLFLIEVLDLIQIQKHAIGGHQRAHLVHDIPDIGQGRGGCVEPAQGPAGLLGNDIGHGGLSGPGGSIEHHVWDLPALNDPAEQAVLSQNMRLPHYLVQSLRTDAVRQRLVHDCPSLLLVKIGAPQTAALLFYHRSKFP